MTVRLYKPQKASSWSTVENIQALQCGSATGGSLSSLLTSVFGQTLAVTGLLAEEAGDTGCVNSDQFWPYVWGRPGKACGLPGGSTTPTPAYLLQALQQYQVETSTAFINYKPFVP